MLAVAIGFGAYALAANGGKKPTPAAAGADQRYGQLPGWLPKAKVPVGRLVTATAAHPWLAVQGDSVLVRLLGAHVLATAVGPAVPEEGEFPVPKTSPCSFTLTFTAASKALPLRASAFSSLDEYGRVHWLTVTTGDGKPLPASIPRGRTITLRLSATLPTGQGRLRWAPLGRNPIVSWDFDVEID